MKGCRTDKYRSRVLVSICKAVLAVPYLTTAVLSPDVYLVKFEAVISDSTKLKSAVHMKFYAKISAFCPGR